MKHPSVFHIFLTCLVVGYAHAHDAHDPSTYPQHATNLINWIRSVPNGFFNDSLEIRRSDPLNFETFFGMFASADIASKDLLLTIPPSIIISSGPDSNNNDLVMNCGTVNNLVKEMKLGNESQYAPYVNYLLETQPHGMLPSAWSKQGQNLLNDILGEYEDDEEQVLPPVDPFGWITEDWYKDCKGANDPFAEHAALLVVQRGWDDLLLPVYDMMSHRNGHWLNTKLKESVHNDNDIHVYASRDIRKGEEIYTTYNFCEDCGNRNLNYGTAEILRDYGFVEQYPQRWFFSNLDVDFEIDEIYNETEEGVKVGSGVYNLTEWIDLAADDMESVQQEYDRLDELGESMLKKYNPNIPETEWNVISDYHKSLMLAMKVAIRQFKKETDGNCLEDDTCVVTNDRYVNLYEETAGVDLSSRHTCDIEKVFEPFEDGTYETIETIQSPYQEILTFRNPKDSDTCFQLDNVVQICTSYRPHYHENVVHYTARYLKDIKRVLWVGGGDSMLLHEILKYKSLEFVVGLELDQKVTRSSFKHFGTQPHYDNDKVQWWYGDASKSLLMLPRHYFGSFDMVLVDLSETVMSHKVTNQLSIMEVLTLLLKPEGIMVKNELYLEPMSAMFDHTIQIVWFDNPAICSQALIMGSNHVPFMTREMNDHDSIRNLFVKPLDDNIQNDPLNLYHDYRKNETSVQLCNVDSEKQTEPLTQEKSPGIIMIVEAEQANVELLKSDNGTGTMNRMIVRVLEQEGFKVMDSASVDSIVVIIAKEGYVVARAFPEHQYCAFDIHLWGSFERQEPLKKALIAAVGSKSSSSFRIIAGGMFGVDTWKNDEMLRGPYFSTHCKDSIQEESRSPHEDLSSIAIQEETLIHSILEESMKFVSTAKDKSPPLVAVLCGDKETHNCKSVDALTNLYQMSATILPLRCPDTEGLNEYTEHAVDRMFACEQHIFHMLNGFISDDTEKLSAILVDSSANDVLAQVLLRILKNELYQERFFAPRVLVYSTMTAPNELQTDGKWRRTFVKRCLEDVFVEEPVFNVEIVFHNNSSIGYARFETALTMNGDKFFVRQLRQVLKSIEMRTGLTAEVQTLAGGLWNYVEDFQPTQSFLPKDYDQSSPFEQWTSQKPQGHQTIFQLESRTSEGVSASSIRTALESTLVNMPMHPKNAGVQINEFSKVGNGIILVSLWSEGSVIIIWDGKVHVDINLFRYEESVEKSNAFQDLFLAELSTFNTVLRDEQPRGIGRVVNFLNDIELRRVDPHWI